MPIRKLKPIEERDPYAAAVFNAFDEIEEKFPSAEAVRPTLEELAAESRVAELAKRIQAESAKSTGLDDLEWLLRDFRVSVFWHAGLNVFVVGKSRCYGVTLAEAIALAVAAYKEKTK